MSANAGVQLRPLASVVGKVRPVDALKLVICW
jgi:hypothetical protein